MQRIREIEKEQFFLELLMMKKELVKDKLSSVQCPSIPLYSPASDDIGPREFSFLQSTMKKTLETGCFFETFLLIFSTQMKKNVPANQQYLQRLTPDFVNF